MAASEQREAESLMSQLNSIIMDGDELGIEREVKYLGVMLDLTLNFKANMCKSTIGWRKKLVYSQGTTE